MRGQQSVRFLVACFTIAIASSYSRCEGFRGLSFVQDPKHMNKKVDGSANVIYNDVTVLTCALRCASKYPCGGFAYNEAERVCTLCALCGEFTLLDAPGYRLYSVMREDPEQSFCDEANICPVTMATPQKCWKQCSGDLQHVSVGPAGVWAVKAPYYIFYRTGTYQDLHSLGTSWDQVGGRLVQLDVGTDTMWGVNRWNVCWYRTDISLSEPNGNGWYQETTGYSWMSISPGGNVWAINTAGEVARYHSAVWEVMGTDMKRVDAGQAGVWALNTTGQLFHRLGTYGDGGSAGTEWRALEGTFQSVSSGRDVVVAVDMEGHIWLRTGLGPDTPTGLAWLRYPGCLKQVEVYQTDEGVVLWGVDFNGSIFFSALND